jgi:prevent-host-death family protein
MKRINMQEAKTHLSRWIEEALRGEEIIFSKSGKPCVRLVPCPPEREDRRLGAWKGRVSVARDFDARDPVLEHLFLGTGIAPTTPPRPSRAKRKGRRR